MNTVWTKTINDEKEKERVEGILEEEGWVELIKVFVDRWDEYQRSEEFRERLWCYIDDIPGFCLEKVMLYKETYVESIVGKMVERFMDYDDRDMLCKWAMNNVISGEGLEDYRLDDIIEMRVDDFVEIYYELPYEEKITKRLWRETDVECPEEYDADDDGHYPAMIWMDEKVIEVMSEAIVEQWWMFRNCVKSANKR